MSTDCPDPALLIAEADGYGTEYVRRHLRHCAECRSAVQDLRDWPDIPEVPGEELSPEESQRMREAFLSALKKLEQN